MKISELQAWLEEQKKLYGDIEVGVQQPSPHDGGETAMLTSDLLGVTDENPDYRPQTTAEMFVTIGYQR
jgi:hypothetical protein